MREEDWEEAKNAFSRCVAIDEDDGESWNNLASMYLRMGTVGKTLDETSDDDQVCVQPKPTRAGLLILYP